MCILYVQFFVQWWMLKWEGMYPWVCTQYCNALCSIVYSSRYLVIVWLCMRQNDTVPFRILLTCKTTSSSILSKHVLCFLQHSRNMFLSKYNMIKLHLPHSGVSEEEERTRKLPQCSCSIILYCTTREAASLLFPPLSLTPECGKCNIIIYCVLPCSYTSHTQEWANEEEIRRKLPPLSCNICNIILHFQHSGVSERAGNSKKAASLVLQYSIILHLPHSTKMREEEDTQGNYLQVCTCTWVAYQCHMSDKSLKLSLRESVSVFLVVSNPRRQVATFRKKVILEKLEREEEKRREWWGGGKRERKRGGDRKRKRRGGEEKKRRGKVERRRKRTKRVKRPRLPLVTHPNNMRGRHHTKRTMQFSRVALSTSILKQLPTEPSLNHYAPNYLHVVFQLPDEGTSVKCSLLMWGIYIYVWNNTWHTIVQSTVSRETFEGENFHKLVKNRFSRRKLLWNAT